MPWYNPSDPTQRNWMFGGLLAVALIVPFRMYIMTPKNEEITQRQEHLDGLTMRNNAAQASIRAGANLEERAALYERHVDRLEELIPAQDEVAVLLDDIQNRARLADIDVIGVDPEATQPAGPYNRRSYSMTVVGEYHAVGRFLTEIASLRRIVTPKQIDISLYPQPETRPYLVSPIVATFRIETYVLPDALAMPQSETAGAGG